MAVHDPQPEITPALTARQIESYLAAAQATYRAAQSHPRYRLRCIGLGAIAGGSALNLVSALVAFSDYWPNAPRWVVFWAAVMYALSTLYQLLDLACTPPRRTTSSSSSSPTAKLLTHHLPASPILLLDTAAFLAFLALLIANGIVITDLGCDDKMQIYVYNSVPWMVCCAAHGLVALMVLPAVMSAQLVGYSTRRERAYCCAECERESKRRHGKGDDDEPVDEARVALLRDVEAGEGVA